MELSSSESQQTPMTLARRVAFFGGSFDPPHLGHLAVAQAALQALSLDAVLFAPVGAQPLKPNGATAPFEHRVAMTRLAIAGEPAFHVSLIDAPADAGRPNYTLHTLESLRSQIPAGGSLFSLMGADSFLSLAHWHRGAEIPFVAGLIVASRPGQDLAALAAHLPAGLTVETAPCSPPNPSQSSIELRCYSICAPGRAPAPFFLLPGLDVEISASAIRSEIRSTAGQPGSGALPPAVAAYIRSNNLYL